jgi:hypothetical protein
MRPTTTLSLPRFSYLLRTGVFRLQSSPLKQAISPQWTCRRCFQHGQTLPAPQDKDKKWRHFLWGEESPNTSSGYATEKPWFPGEETAETKLLAFGSGIAKRMATDRKIKCTEFDKEGNLIAGHEEIKRSDLVSKVWHYKIPLEKTALTSCSLGS